MWNRVVALVATVASTLGFFSLLACSLVFVLYRELKRVKKLTRLNAVQTHHLNAVAQIRDKCQANLVFKENAGSSVSVSASTPEVFTKLSQSDSAAANAKTWVWEDPDRVVDSPPQPEKHAAEDSATHGTAVAMTSHAPTTRMHLVPK